MVKCYLCGFNLKNEKSLNFHIWQKHPEEYEKIKIKKENNKIVCEFCGKKFKNNMGLRQHIGRQHKDIIEKEKNQKIELIKKYKFECEICGYKVNTLHGLKTHIGMHHKVEESDKKFKCKICNKQFDTLQGISLHIVHTHKITIKDYYIKILENKIEYCECGNEKKFINLFNGYRETCGNKYCKFNIEKSSKNYKKTCLKKYGVSNYLKTEEGKQKLRNKSKDSIRKRKITNKIRFGNEEAMRNKEIKDKQQKSMNDHGWKKFKETCLKKYGVEYYTKTDKWKHHYKDIFLKKYGVDHPMKVLAIKLRAIENSQKSNKSKGYSKISVKIFNELIKSFNLEKYNPFYKNKEKMYYDENKKIFKYDFVIEIDEKPVLIIEYNGIIFHPKNNTIPCGNPYKINIELAKQNDIKREIFGNKISKNRFYVIWEDEWKLDKERIMKDLTKLFLNLPGLKEGII